MGRNRTSPDERPPPRRLLLCFAGGLGDLVMTLPLMARATKQCETWLYAHEGYRQWLGLIDVPGLHLCKSDADLREPFDAMILTHSTPAPPPVDKSPPIVAYAGRNYPFPCHATEANFAAAEFVGLRDDGCISYPVRWTHKGLEGAEGKYIVVCPDVHALGLNGGFGKKLLPFTTWRKVVAKLRKSYPHRVILQLDKAFPVQIGADACTIAADAQHLAALLKHAEAVLTVDCGVAHLAAALGTPTVIAWGPTSKVWSMPVGPSAAVITHGECGQCLGTAMWDSCALPSCMMHSAQGIVDVLDTLLAAETICA